VLTVNSVVRYATIFVSRIHFNWPKNWLRSFKQTKNWPRTVVKICCKTDTHLRSKTSLKRLVLHLICRTIILKKSWIISQTSFKTTAQKFSGNNPAAMSKQKMMIAQDCTHRVWSFTLPRHIGRAPNKTADLTHNLTHGSLTHNSLIHLTH